MRSAQTNLPEGKQSRQDRSMSSSMIRSMQKRSRPGPRRLIELLPNPVLRLLADSGSPVLATMSGLLRSPRPAGLRKKPSAMTPKQMDGQHRSFYADEDGVIHANEEGPADEKSPVVK